MSTPKDVPDRIYWLDTGHSTSNPSLAEDWAGDHGDVVEFVPATPERELAGELAELVDQIYAHYSGSLDHQPPYVRRARTLLARLREADNAEE